MGNRNMKRQTTEWEKIYENSYSEHNINNTQISQKRKLVCNFITVKTLNI